MAQIPQNSLTKNKEKSLLMVTILHSCLLAKRFFSNYFKPDKKAKLSTPSAYWESNGFCKLPKGS